MKHTLETRQKISAGLMGRVCSEETRAKLSASNRGQVRSLETRANLSAANQGKRHSLKTRAKMSEAHKANPQRLGVRLSREELAQRKATRLRNNGGLYQTKNGWQHSDVTKERMRIANVMRGMRGELNPFFGRRHSPESRAKMSSSTSGPRHRNWRGGVSRLPYGPEFGRPLKRTILGRDGHRCQRCGKHQAELKRKLQVHHLDHNKMNNAPNNLAASCGPCNVWASNHRAEPFTLLAEVRK